MLGLSFGLTWSRDIIHNERVDLRKAIFLERSARAVRLRRLAGAEPLVYSFTRYGEQRGGLSFGLISSSFNSSFAASSLGRATSLASSAAGDLTPVTRA